jgi:hypothetical protein
LAVFGDNPNLVGGLWDFESLTVTLPLLPKLFLTENSTSPYGLSFSEISITRDEDWVCKCRDGELEKAVAASKTGKNMPELRSVKFNPKFCRLNASTDEARFQNRSSKNGLFIMRI